MTAVVRVALAIVFVFGARTTHGQEVPLQRDLDRASLVFLGGASVDWASTWVANRQGVHEQNPVLSWSEDRPARMIAIGAGIDFAGLVAVRAAAKKWHHEKIATVALYGSAAFRVWLGYANFVAANITAQNAAQFNQRRR